MTAKEYSILIENQLRKVNTGMYGSSDQILINPYEVIVNALSFRVSEKMLQQFKASYKPIKRLSLQHLIDNNFDIEKIIDDIKIIIRDNEKAGES